MRHIVRKTDEVGQMSWMRLTKCSNNTRWSKSIEASIISGQKLVPSVLFLKPATKLKPCKQLLTKNKQICYRNEQKCHGANGTLTSIVFTNPSCYHPVFDGAFNWILLSQTASPSATVKALTIHHQRLNPFNQRVKAGHLDYALISQSLMSSGF